MAIYLFPLPGPAGLGHELSPDVDRLSVQLQKGVGGEHVIRVVIDETAPTADSATTNGAGTSIAITVSEPLDETSIPATTDFALNGTSASITGVAVSGTTVTLTVDTVIADETVTVDYTQPSEAPLIDLWQNKLASFTTLACTNITIPKIVSSTVAADGATIALVYDANLDEASVPAIGDFTLNGTSSVVDTGGVGVSTTTVTLTVDTPVLTEETVTVDYTPGTNKIQAATSNTLAAALSGQATTNSVPTTLSTAAIPAAGTTVVLTFADALDEASEPAPGDFGLNGTSSAVASVGISGAVVTLTLNVAVDADETITTDYTAGTNKLRGATEKANVANLSAEATTNNGLPQLLSTAIDAAGTSVLLTYNGALDEGSTPANGDYNLNGTSASVDGVGVSGAVVTLTVSTVIYGETVTVDYTPGTNKIQSAVDNDLAAALSAEAVTNGTAPLFATGHTPDGGDYIYCTFTGALDPGSVPATTAFAIGGDDATVSAVAVLGGTLKLTLTGVIESGDSPTVTYTKPGSNPLTELAGGFELISAGPWAIENASSQV